VIERTGHTLAAFVENMGVNHRGADVGMTEQFLHSTDIVTAFQQMRGKRMPKGVRRSGLAKIGIARRLFHGPLYGLLLNMMPPHLAATWVGGELCGGEYILPNPLPGGIGVFAFQRIRQINTAETLRQIGKMQFLDLV